MIDCPPQVVRLPVDLHEDFIEVPTLLRVAFRAIDPLPLYIRCEKRTEPVPPEPHSLMADIDPALEQQVFNIPEVQGKANIHHHHKSNNLR